MVEHLITLVGEGVSVTFPEPRGNGDYQKTVARHAGKAGAGRPKIYHFSIAMRCLTHPYTCIGNYRVDYAVYGNCLKDAILRTIDDRYPPVATDDTSLLGPLQEDWWKDEPVGMRWDIPTSEIGKETP